MEKHVIMKIRCYNCRKKFEVRLVKEQDAPDKEKMRWIRPCPYCKKDNAIEVEANRIPPDKIYREIIPGKKVE